ncbi:MAG: dihydrofolate reductase family protein [Bacteroidota bacterium]|nr:dihydrofolate reductase family protein [Bacteroidota bacterium]
METTQIQLFIAQSIDGYIAREDGSLDWLLGLPNPKRIDHGYNELINGVDTIIMGRKTYEELLALVEEWPYPNYKTYVVTGDQEYRVKTEQTFPLYQIDRETIENLKSESTKNIWLVGGGTLITQFLNLDAIDEMTLSIIPVILGKGIRLFSDSPKETPYTLIKLESFETGVVNLVYRNK